MHDDLFHILNEVEDPELGIGIIDLGLVHRAQWAATGIEVDFTTTVASCPYAASLQKQIEAILHDRFREASSILVRLVFDPPWTLARLSDNARHALGWARSSKTPADSLSLSCRSKAGIRKH
jgi:metal-sulfur cluster biosynthetic enzyme